MDFPALSGGNQICTNLSICAGIRALFAVHSSQSLKRPALEHCAPEPIFIFFYWTLSFTIFRAASMSPILLSSSTY